MRRTFRVFSILIAVLSIVGCRPTVGHECSPQDMALARTLVYDSNGSPAFAGQAMMIGSCAGGGSFCHADGATRRYGAPFDLNLDPLLADDAHNADVSAGMQHLFDAQIRIHHDRDSIYQTVLNGSMPPGQAGVDTLARAYQTYSASGEPSPMPGLNTVEGVELLRVWLACGSPVVQGTSAVTPPACTRDADCSPVPICDGALSRCVSVGYVEPARQVSIAPTWASIYSNIVSPTCAIAACHGTDGAAFSGNLDLSSPAIAYAAMVNVPALTPSCGTRIVPGNPSGSFLVAKLENTQDVANCGLSMPPDTSLSSDQLAAVRQWITAGAPQD